MHSTRALAISRIRARTSGSKLLVRAVIYIYIYIYNVCVDIVVYYAHIAYYVCGTNSYLIASSMHTLIIACTVRVVAMAF